MQEFTMKSVFGLIILFVFFNFSNAFYWTNASGDGKWSTPTNWTPYGVPGSSDDVDLIRTDGLGISLDTTDTIKNIYVDGSNLNVVQLYFNAGKSLYISDSNADFVDNHGINVHFVRHGGSWIGLLSGKTRAFSTLTNDTMPNMLIGGGLVNLGSTLYCDTIVTSGGTLTTNNNAIFCNGFYNYTYLNPGASTITINGSFISPSNTFNDQTSTIEMINAGTVICSDGFYNATFASSLHTITLGGDLLFNHGLTIDSTYFAGNHQILGLFNNGNFFLNIDTISQLQNINNFIIWTEYFNTVSIPSNQHYPLFQASQINYGYSSFNVSTGGLTCTTLFFQSSAGSSNAGFNFDDQTIKCNNMQVSYGYSNDHLTINLGSGSLYVYGNAYFMTGTGYDNFNLQTGKVYVYGSWLNTSVSTSSIDPGTSTVYFMGTSGNQQIESNNQHFYNINIGNGNSGATYSLDDSLQVEDTLRIDGDTLNTANLPVYTSNLFADSGTIYANNSNIYVNKDLVFTGTGDTLHGVFTCGTSTVYLTGSGHLQTIDGWGNHLATLVQSNGDTTTAENYSVVGNFVSGDSTSRFWSTDSMAGFRIVGALTNNGVKWGGGGAPLQLGLGMLFGTGASGNFGDCILVLNSPIGLGGNVTTTGYIQSVGDSTNTNGYNLSTNGLYLRTSGNYVGYNARLFISGSSVITDLGSLVSYGSDATHVQGIIDVPGGSPKIYISKNFNLQEQIGIYGSHSFLSLGNILTTFDGTSGIDSIYSHGQYFGAVTINAPGSTTMLFDSLTVVGNFTHTAGTFNTNGQKIHVTGNYIDTTKSSSAYDGLNGTIISVGGNAAFLGSLGNLIDLNASSTWHINVTGSLAAGYATIGNSTAGLTQGIADSTVVNSGNNVNWLFSGHGGGGLLNNILRFFHIYRMG
jgi:hypothetical protein